MAQFHDDERGDPLLGPSFETVLLYRGCFGHAAGFELIALETRHGGRRAGCATLGAVAGVEGAVRAFTVRLSA